MEYFALFGNRDATIQIRCIKGRHDSFPPQVLGRLQDRLAREELRPRDEAWLVVDKDHWTDGQLRQLHGWSPRGENYGFALSNPKFEYWLLLHFEDGAGVGTARECTQRLARYLGGQGKGLEVRRFTPQSIRDAILRAKARDNPPCTDWPRAVGSTTVYRLVERLQSE